MKKVFVSYSRRNLDVVERLARDLQDAGLDVWVDFRKIKGGEAWRQAIYNGVIDSEFTIICLSPPAVESEWVRHELEIAHQHNKLIIPVMLERAFEEMEAHEVTKVLLDVQIINFADLPYERAFPTLLSSLPGVYTPGQDYDDIDPSEIQNPFKGLESFQEFDSEIFFGREELVNRALERLESSLTNPESANFLGVIGASGSGKSSMVRAGLIPAIRKGRLTGSEDFPIAILKPGGEPIESLARRLWPLLSDKEDLDSLLSDLHESPTALADIAAEMMRNSAENAFLVLVVDQFEELFTRSPYSAQVEFIELLHHAVTDPDSRVIVIVTMRADFFDRVGHFANLARLIEDDKLLIVSEMSPEELRRSIEGPAIAVGLVYDHGLPDRLLEEVLQQPGSLPLLQYALTELYDRRDRRRLTWDAYNDIGGVRQALAQHAEQIFMSLNSAQQDIMQRLLLRLVEVSETGEATRRRVRQSELTFERVSDNALMDLLTLMTSAEVRLLVASREVSGDNEDDGEPTIWIEVVHEALIREWERFQGWVKEDEENLRLSTEILKSAHDWVNGNRDDAYLLTSTRLDRALVWVQTADANALQREFINISADARRLQQQQEREQQRYVSQLEERSAQRLRILATGLFIGIIIVAVFAGLAVVARGQAESQAEETRSRTLAQEVTDELSNENPNSPLALALAIEANSIDNPPAVAQSALADASYFGPRWLTEALMIDILDTDLYTLHDAGDFYELYIVQNGTGGTETTVTAWIIDPDGIGDDSETQIEVMWNDTVNTALLTLVVGEDHVAAGAEDGRVFTWLRTGELKSSMPTQLSDTTSDENVASSAVYDNAIRSLAFSPQDVWLAVGTESGDILIYDVETLGLESRLQGHEGRVLTLVFNEAGNRLLSGGIDTTVRLWRPNNNGEQLSVMREHITWVRSAVFSPNSQQAVTGSSDGTIIIWRITNENTNDGDSVSVSPQHILRNVHDGSVQRIDYSPVEQSFVSAASDSEIILWDSILGQQRHDYSDHRTTVSDVIYNADGEHLLSIDTEMRLMLWDVEPGPVTRRYEFHDDWVQDVAFSPTSNYGISGSLDGTLVLWNFSDDSTQPLDILYTGDRAILSTAYAPDGQTALVGLDDGTLLLWDVERETNWTLRGSLSGHTDGIRSIIYNPINNGEALTTSDDTQIILWDVRIGEIISRYNAHNSEVFAAAFTPDGEHVLSGDEEGQILWWDIDTGEHTSVEQLDGEHPVHNDSIRAIAISPNGEHALSASDDLQLIRWDINNGRPTARDVLEGHQARVTSLSFSNDSQYALSASDDQTIIMWETLDWLAIRRLLGHGNIINSVQYSPDGRHALSGGVDRSVILWRIDTAQELLNWTIINREVAALGCDERAVYQVEDCTNDEPPRSTPLVTVAVESPTPYIPPTANAPDNQPEPILTLPGLAPTAEIAANIQTFTASDGSQRGTLQAGERHRWQFAGRAGQIVTLNVLADVPARVSAAQERNPDGFDPTLTVYNPLGKRMIEMDDIRDGLITDVQIARLTLPADGIYEFEVGAWNDASGGEYTLQIIPILSGDEVSTVATDED